LGRAKDILVEPISRKDADAIVKRHHYSGKVVQNSQLHLGVFLDGKCGGAMQFGPSLDKRKMLGLVSDTRWNGFIELNRMAFADWLPRNSESRAIGFAFRWMRKQYPHIEWCVSFSDGTQCGDGTIYRASGFVLTGIKKNNQVWAKEGDQSSVISRITVTSKVPKNSAICASSNGASSMKRWADAGYAPLPGFQLRYLYFINPEARGRLTVPALPFSAIDAAGARMYKGKTLSAGSADGGTVGVQPIGGGSIPTPALYRNEAANV